MRETARLMATGGTFTRVGYRIRRIFGPSPLIRAIREEKCSGTPSVRGYLAVGASINGINRGQKTHRIPAIEEQPEVFLARVFLDTSSGPVAVQVDAIAIAHLAALNAKEGDAIIITSPAKDRFVVARENP